MLVDISVRKVYAYLMHTSVAECKLDNNIFNLPDIVHHPCGPAAVAVKEIGAWPGAAPTLAAYLPAAGPDAGFAPAALAAAAFAPKHPAQDRSLSHLTSNLATAKGRAGPLYLFLLIQHKYTWQQAITALSLPASPPAPSSRRGSPAEIVGTAWHHPRTRQVGG